MIPKWFKTSVSAYRQTVSRNLVECFGWTKKAAAARTSGNYKGHGICVFQEYLDGFDAYDVACSIHTDAFFEKKGLEYWPDEPMAVPCAEAWISAAQEAFSEGYMATFSKALAQAASILDTVKSADNIEKSANLRYRIAELLETHKS